MMHRIKITRLDEYGVTYILLTINDVDYYYSPEFEIWMIVMNEELIETVHEPLGIPRMFMTLYGAS